MDECELKSTIEAVLFAAGEPVTLTRLSLVLGLEKEAILEAAKRLADDYAFHRRGIRLVRMQETLQLCSAPEYAQIITQALERRKPPKLSQPALEALAVCAYFQPVTRAYVDQVRGVDSSYTMGLLLERGLIEACGRLDVPGRPAIYRTSELFLRMMGVSDLTELPRLPELTGDGDAVKLEEAIEALKAENGVQLEIQT